MLMIVVTWHHCNCVTTMTQIKGSLNSMICYADALFAGMKIHSHQNEKCLKWLQWRRSPNYFLIKSDRFY